MPSYIDPRTGEENTNITDRRIMVTFTYAADDKADPEMRGEIVQEINELATRLGCDADISPEVTGPPVTYTACPQCVRDPITWYCPACGWST